MIGLANRFVKWMCKLLRLCDLITVQRYCIKKFNRLKSRFADYLNGAKPLWAGGYPSHGCSISADVSALQRCSARMRLPLRIAQMEFIFQRANSDKKIGFELLLSVSGAGL